MSIFKIPFYNGVLLLAGIVTCCNLQAEENKKQPVIGSQGKLFSNTSSETDEMTLPKSESATHLYGGIGLTASSTNSDFKMDYEINKDNFPEAIPHLQHKESSLKKIGASIVTGIKVGLNRNFFLAVEGNYTCGTKKHWHTFTQSEDIEFGDIDGVETQNISCIDIKYKDEIGAFLKCGTTFRPYEFYGIFGVSAQKAEVRYDLDPNADGVNQSYSDGFSQRVCGPVIGAGMAVEITDNISCALEYKYKKYNRICGNLEVVKDDVFGGNHDSSVRRVEIKDNKQELSLIFTLHTKL